jgi:hypothetical protein
MFFCWHTAYEKRRMEATQVLINQASHQHYVADFDSDMSEILGKLDFLSFYRRSDKNCIDTVLTKCRSRKAFYNYE